ncbi:MAG TPA: AEC family transporter [Ruminiclostridium sp.]|jgi:hypothetical protein|nr:AEC family transporter [Ruminiclostridium sp.]
MEFPDDWIVSSTSEQATLDFFQGGLSYVGLKIKIESQINFTIYLFYVPCRLQRYFNFEGGSILAEFFIVLNQVIILFILIIIGYTAGKAKIIDSTATKSLSAITLYITNPMMVLGAFFIDFSPDRMVNVLWILGAGAGTFLISILVSRLLYRRFDESKAPVLMFTAIFSNCGNMGLPMLKSLFGDEGVFYASFYIGVFYIVLWSYGFMLFGGKGTKKEIAKKVLVNPSIIAVYIGLIIFIFRIPVHSTIKEAVGYVADMTLPVAMLTIGGIISTLSLPSVLSDRLVYLASGVRLILMPMLALIFVRIIGAPTLPGAVVVTALAMPAAAMATAFSETFNKDSAFASKCVLVSTLLSLITTPLMVLLMVKVMG